MRIGFRALELLVVGSLGAMLVRAQNTQTPANPKVAAQSESEAIIKTGQALFQQNCAFCHGKNANGGETGPDLTDSPLVASDVHGNKISQVVKQGRPEKGMPAFQLADPDLNAIVAFIHMRRDIEEAHPGGRRRVEVADLQTGNVALGKQYFEGPGKCATCHSPTGDLKGVAARHAGLRLEEQLLFPQGAKAKVTVILPSGKTLEGELKYRDEFAIGLVDQDGWYHSWPVSAIKYKIDDPAQAHAELLGKYTDDDVHNLMAYLQTLK